MGIFGNKCGVKGEEAVITKGKDGKLKTTYKTTKCKFDKDHKGRHSFQH